MDYPIDEGKDELTSIGFKASYDNPDKSLFLFMYEGEQIGQMITCGKFREAAPDFLRRATE